MLDRRRFRTAALVLLGLASGCAPGARRPGARPSTLALTSAEAEARPRTLSCQAAVFCREDTVMVPDEDAMEELVESCAEHGGRSSWTPCRRDDVLATCDVSSGELGPVHVLTYAQPDAAKEAEVLRKVSDICERFEGSFVRVKR